MFQVRFHGRGGQGVVTAAELLASAAFPEDRYAQAFPSFSSERMGAFLNVESEFAATSVAIGASAAGARATPAGSSCTPRPTRKQPTCTSRPSGSPRNCPTR